MKQTHCGFLLLTAVALIMARPAAAQRPMQVDLLKQLRDLPSVPTSAQDASAKCDCNTGPCLPRSPYPDFDQRMQGFLSQIGTANDDQLRQKADAEQMNRDMQGKSDEQKLAMLKQRGMAGDTNALAFAQQMRDPAMQQRLKNMSPSEKMAFMQNAGMIKKDKSGLSSDPGLAASRADFQQKMQDPSFRAWYNGLSKEEKTKYMKQNMEEHGTDFKQLAKNAKSARQSTSTDAPDTASIVSHSSDDLFGDDATVASPTDAARAPAEHLVAEAQQVNSGVMADFNNFGAEVRSINDHIDSIGGMFQDQISHANDVAKRNLYISMYTAQMGALDAGLKRFDSVWSAEKTHLASLAQGFNTDFAAHSAVLDGPTTSAVGSAQLSFLGFLREMNKANTHFIELGATLAKSKKEMEATPVGSGSDGGG